MRYLQPKIFLAVICLSLCPLMANATEATTNVSLPKNTTEESSKKAESFESICISSWMKRFENVPNKVAYKDFGEKYCACALTQPLDTDAAVDKAIQVCMTRSILRDSMDNLEEKVGLDKATDKDINQYCMDTWNLIYPQMSDQAKQNSASFCTCSEPKLMEIIKASDGLTDKEYYVRIENIATTCGETVKPNASPTSTTP